MIAGVIDVGTNSVRLLAADVRDGKLVELERDLVITRLGEGVDAARRLGPEPLRRSVAAIAQYTERARTLGAERIRVIATSAVRDSSNRAEFVDAVRAACGIEPEVLSGDEEARLGFEGATSDLEGGPFVIVDVGGGSTEFVRGSEKPERWISVDIGSVRLTERHISSDPPGAPEIEALRAEARERIEGAARTVGVEPAMVVGLAGTITTVAALVLGLKEYDRARIHHVQLSRKEVEDAAARLAAMTTAERGGLPVMPRGREDVIVAGVVIFIEVMRRFGAAQIVVSERDILDGAALDLTR